VAQSSESKCEEDRVDGGGGPASLRLASAAWKPMGGNIKSSSRQVVKSGLVSWDVACYLVSKTQFVKTKCYYICHCI